ncbi:MAG TPA: ABC transporter ATP-binding protein [Tepidisphaeraceae bacterium]|nr:ABC transporter ATP-binding protein [Tepidisphaeraceae bacterium]
MSQPAPRKSNDSKDFWRACRFLLPYWPMVATSIFCAIFVSAAFTGGLGSLMPIMRVLIAGQTVSQWANGQIVEHRLAIKLADVADAVNIVHVDPGGIGDRQGIRTLNQITFVEGMDNRAMGDVNRARAILSELSDPGRRSATISIAEHEPLSIHLGNEPLPYRVLRWLAGKCPQQPVKAIAAILGVIFCLAIISNVASFFQEYLSDKSAVLAILDIRRRLYNHVLHLPMSHFGSAGTSDVTSRLTQDAQGLGEGFNTVLGQAIQEPIKAAMAFALALAVSWKLTLFIVFFTPIMLMIIKKFGKKMRRASKKALMNNAMMLGQVESSLGGIRVVKGASSERFERRRYIGIIRGLVEQQLKMARIDAFSTPTMDTLNLVVISIVVLFASYMVLVTHELETTSFFLVMACLGGIGDSLRRVSKVNNVLQKSNAAATRIFYIMDMPIERSRRTAGERLIKLPPLAREIRFENISFTYPNAPAPALENVSLAIAKGTRIAIVGRNGSGKTTLLTLLPRLYDPQEGRVLLDGVDVRKATLRSLRQQISIVTQDSVIFPGTIADNIAYGNPRATREQVIAAAQRAFAHGFILEKSAGYDTRLGEMGGQLSGGQKQRLCIARAILRNAPILILDEATSQVDAESERLIQKAIESLLHTPAAEIVGGKRSGDAASFAPTLFVIAHRLSTIQNADTIVVMDRGQIVGQGAHTHLLRTCEAYRQFYDHQLFAAPAPPIPPPDEPLRDVG